MLGKIVIGKVNKVMDDKEADMDARHNADMDLVKEMIRSTCDIQQNHQRLLEKILTTGIPHPSDTDRLYQEELKNIAKDTKLNISRNKMRMRRRVADDDEEINRYYKEEEGDQR